MCCVNLPDRGYLKKRTEAFNNAIDVAVVQAGKNFFVADLFQSQLKGDSYYDYTVDGLHPSESGMEFIAETIEKAINSNCSRY